MAWLLAPRLDLHETAPFESLVAWLRLAGSAGYEAVAMGDLEAGGSTLDPFAVIGALAGETDLPVLAASCEIGTGRSASVMARELTTVDHLTEGRTGLVLLGRDAVHLSEAEAVIAALLDGGPATVRGTFEHVQDAPNRPAPLSPGGPPLLKIDQSQRPPRAFGRTLGDSAPVPWTIVFEEVGRDVPTAPADATTIVVSPAVPDGAATSLR